MFIEYLGQAGLLIETGKSAFLIDPYLSNYVVTGGFGSAELFSRSFPPPILPNDLPPIDGVFITHSHADHCDLETLIEVARRNPECVFIGPHAVEHILTLNGFPQANIVVPAVGIPLALCEIGYHCIPAAHYELERDPYTGGYPYLGYLINFDGFTLYHSGDTILYPGMVETILDTGWHVDVACLPVNGRDARREKLGITGNLNASEALSLARSINARFLIPMHNDLFLVNQEDPEVIGAELQKSGSLKILNLKHGEKIDLEK